MLPENASSFPAPISCLAEEPMQNFQPRFQGLFIPYVTPFEESGALDIESLERLTNHFVSLNAVAGLVSALPTEEGRVLTMKERPLVKEGVGKIARRAGRPQIAPITPQPPEEAFNLGRPLKTLPGDAPMISPPLLFAWGKVEGELKFR